MWYCTLRPPPPAPARPPPPFDPVVEAWLDALPPPTTKPSDEELRQWRLGNYRHGLERGVFLTCLLLRAVSLAIALAVTGIVSSAVVARLQGPSPSPSPSPGPYSAVDRLVPSLAVCPVVALWNAAEFVAACFFRDRGISPSIHVWADGLLFLGLAAATGILLVDVICGVADFAATREIPSACSLIVLM